MKNFPTILIIFGATGDLMGKKLLPAIFRLYQGEFLPELFRVIGFAKEPFNDKEYREWLKNKLKKAKQKKVKEDFLKKFTYQAGLFEDLKSYRLIAQKLGAIDGQFRACANKLFYLAVPPNFYETIFKNLAKSGLTLPCSPQEGWTRVLVEKPFGTELNQAKKLDRLLTELFKEVQVYRIDHYLAKETVLNLLIFRFSNSVFENIWNKNFIEKIEIKLLEKAGVENRGSFYDNLGALRDVGQNHILQMLALAAMEPPANLAPEEISKKKAEILKSLAPMSKENIEKNTIRGQYRGYRKVKGVSRLSQSETYFRIKTSLNHPRWQGVPIFLESGKRLDKDLGEIAITFRQTTSCLFCPPGNPQKHKNTLTFRLAPREGIIYCFFVKKPGPKMTIEKKELHFLYQESYPKTKLLPPYEHLLMDAFLGDQTLFVSNKENLYSWQFIDPILKGWRKNLAPLKIYKAGSKIPGNKLQ